MPGGFYVLSTTIGKVVILTVVVWEMFSDLSVKVGWCRGRREKYNDWYDSPVNTQLPPDITENSVRGYHHHLRQDRPAPFVVGFDAHLQTRQINPQRSTEQTTNYNSSQNFSSHLVRCSRLQPVETVAGEIVLGMDLELHSISRGDGDLSFRVDIKIQIVLKFNRL